MFTVSCPTANGALWWGAAPDNPNRERTHRNNPDLESELQLTKHFESNSRDRVHLCAQVEGAESQTIVILALIKYSVAWDGSRADVSVHARTVLPWLEPRQKCVVVFVKLFNMVYILKVENKILIKKCAALTYAKFLFHDALRQNGRLYWKFFCAKLFTAAPGEINIDTTW